MHARRSLIALGFLALLCGAGLAQVPGLGIVGGIISGQVFSAWNPADAGAGSSFSNANRTITITTSVYGGVMARGSLSHNAGKWYFEITATTVGAGGSNLGIATASAALGGGLSLSPHAYGYYSSDGNIWRNSGATAYGASYTDGDVIGVAVDLTNLKLYLRKNGTWQNSADPAAGTGGHSIVAGTYFPATDAVSFGGSVTSVHTINTGKTAFANSPPAGFSAWK